MSRAQRLRRLERATGALGANHRATEDIARRVQIMRDVVTRAIEAALRGEPLPEPEHEHEHEPGEVYRDILEKLERIALEIGGNHADH